MTDADYAKAMKKETLFHTGFAIIEKPDIKAGRKNADFGQGFYLSSDEEFSKRWSHERKGLITYLNKYELDTEGLKIKHLNRNLEWVEYICANRSNKDDMLADFDVITGPVAIDTLYDTFGIITSGLLSASQSLRILSAGAVFRQTVIKTDKAAGKLRFVSATEIPGNQISAYKAALSEEESKFQIQLAQLIQEISDGSNAQ